MCPSASILGAANGHKQRRTPISFFGHSVVSSIMFEPLQAVMTQSQQGNEDWWRDHLVKGPRLEHLARRLFPLLPSSPRCKICFVPFAGFGLPLRFLGWSPSRKNPRLCTWCCERMPPGGAEVDIAALFPHI